MKPSTALFASIIAICCTVGYTSGQVGFANGTEQTASTGRTPNAGNAESEGKEQTSKIAFVSRRDGNDEIYLVNPNGSHLENITNDPSSDTFPAWSPDGKTIAFQSDRDGDPDIYVMNTDGSNIVQLTDDTTEDSSPAWSPDGKRIAYVVTQGSDLYIHVMKADGSERKRLGAGMLPSWSPDGKRIAFNRGQIPQMYIMDSDGNNIAPLIEPPSDASTLTRQQMVAFMLPNISPIWSPDGKRVLFTRVLVDAPEISVPAPAAAHPEQPVKTGTVQEILQKFISKRPAPAMNKLTSKRPAPAMNYEVFTMDTDGGNQRRLTDAPGWDVGKGWSPSGREIVFERGRVGGQEIYIMNSDGSNQRRLTTDPARDYYPSWSPTLPSK